MLKKVATLLLISILFTVVSGCWSRKEIETLAFVTLLGMDKEGQDTVVTVQIALPQTGGEGGGGSTDSPVWTVVSRGRNTGEAIRNMTSITGKRIYLPHVRAFIIGEELAKAGLDETTDFLNRTPDLRGTHWVAVTKGKASDVMKIQPKLTTMPAFYIDEMLRNISQAATAPPVTWLQFTRNQVSSMKIGNYAPGIQVFNAEEGRIEAPEVENQESEGQSKGQGDKSAGENNQPGEALRLEGVAVFKENRLVGWLNQKEARGLNWIRGELIRSVTVLEDSKLGNGTVTKLTTFSKRRIRVTPEGDSVKIDLYINQEGNLLEQTLDTKIAVPEKIEVLNQEVSNVVKREVELTLNKLQKEFKADITTISEQVRAQQPDIAQRLDWEKEFPNVKINVHVDANLRRTGSNVMPTYKKIVE